MSDAPIFGTSDRSPAHVWISALLLVETLCVLVALAAAALLAAEAAAPLWLRAALTLALGLWLDRLYTIGHEAAHRKLFPDHPRLNDLAGALALAPLLVPLAVFRKIHAFHHGHNRRAPKVATLDVVLLPPGPGIRRALARALGWATWTLGVFAGGFYLHGLVSVVLFLLLPTALARRVSPAFAGWRPRLRARAWAELGAGVLLHAGLWLGLGREAWLAALGLPTLAFAWIYSMLVYIYHYRTPVGAEVRSNVRSLPPSSVMSWVLLNFNEHATHHADPRIPWYLLPLRRSAARPAPEARPPRTIARAVLRQLRGPIFVEREARP